MFCGIIRLPVYMAQCCVIALSFILIMCGFETLICTPKNIYRMSLIDYIYLVNLIMCR